MFYYEVECSISGKPLDTEFGILYHQYQYFFDAKIYVRVVSLSNIIKHIHLVQAYCDLLGFGVSYKLLNSDLS